MNILDEILARVARLEKKSDARPAKRNKYERARRLPFLELGELYGVSSDTVREMLHHMSARGFAVEVSRLGDAGKWLVNVKQFDNAYDKLKNTNFLKHEYL